MHHFRTTIRRLRSLLSSFKDVAPGAERKALNGRLKTLSQRYANLAPMGRVHRNRQRGQRRRARADAATAGRGREETPPRPGPAAISSRSRATSRRSTATSAATEWLHSADRRATPPSGTSGSTTTPTELLDKQWRKLRKDSRKLDLSDSPAFHKFRIAAKKHRYTIEVLASLYRKKEVKPYLQRVVALQDLLGDMRDAMAAEELIGQLDLAPQR